MAHEATALGPISYLIVQFPGDRMTGEGFARCLTSSSVASFASSI